MSRAACCLKADRRIAMSGTPIQNKIEDIWALFKFIRLDPVDVKEVFNERIGTPCKTGDNVGVARLQLVMRCCALRRTKESKREDGVPILQLPQRHDTVIKLTLNESESEAYQAVVGEGKEKVQELEKQGKLGKNIRNVLQELLKLRQICDHVELANTGETEEDYDGSLMEYNVAVQGIEREGLNLARAQSVVANRKATEGDELDCVGCGVKYDKYFPALYPDGDLEPLTDLARLESKPLFTKCLHIYCEFDPSSSCNDVALKLTTIIRHEMLQNTSTPPVPSQDEGMRTSTMYSMRNGPPTSSRCHRGLPTFSRRSPSRGRSEKEAN